MKRLYVLCALLLTLAASQLFANGPARQVLRVPADFATIQQAVDAAEPGDVIMVAPGTYCEHVVIAKSDLRLHAAPANQATILSGECLSGGYGFFIQGTLPDNPVRNVEISGFTVEGFETGFALNYATRSRLHLNVARANLCLATTMKCADGADGIVLQASTFNEITQNTLRENGHLGIGLRNGSSYNLVRGNRLYDNQAQQDTYPTFACSLMLWGTANVGNQIVENEVVGTRGRGIMIGAGPSTNNVIAQNRVHGHAGAGIILMGPEKSPARGNFILQNDARGNGNGPTSEFDLVDMFESDNVWLRNLGTCKPGNAGCE